MTTRNDRRIHVWFPAAATALFAAAHTQPAVFYSNQNQYFLHGLAAAGRGDLAADWLAATKDPTPVFSKAVAVLYSLTGERGVYAVFFGLAAAYFLSLWAVVAATPWKPARAAGRWAFAAALIAVHSGAARAASVSAFGVDYPWYFQAGVANQYVLGAGLQPSVFGVFLLTAIALFAHGRHYLAAVAIAVACTLHSTYLLPGALLVVGMMARLTFTHSLGTAARVGAVALVGVLPVTVAAAVVFRPTDSETFAEAQRVIAWVRIPHHCDVNRWLDLVAWLQIAWAGLGVIALRRTNLFAPLAVAALLAILLSVLQSVTHSATLALLFPWRLSAVLVPLATAVLFARVVSPLERRIPATALLVGAGVLLVAAVAGTKWVMAEGRAYQVGTTEDGLQRDVAANRRPGEIYLLPATFPKPPSKPGSGSSSFVPVPTTGPVIFELQRFRLESGAAAYVDFKSIPYADTDVIEWHTRVKNCVRWYGAPDWDTAGLMDEVQAAGITHVAVPAGGKVSSRHLREVYADDNYRLFRVE